MKRVVIASGVRSALGSLGDDLSLVLTSHLGSIVIGEAIRRGGINTKDVDEVLMENVLGIGIGEDFSSYLKSSLGIPNTTGILITNKASGSSLMLGVLDVAIGRADIVVVGGMENPSQTNTRGYWILDVHAELAEFAGQVHGVTRENIDQFTAESQSKVSRAMSEGRFEREIISVEVPHAGGIPTIFNRDEILGNLRESVAVGKAKFSRIAIGAGALVLMSEEKATSLGVVPMANVVAWGTPEARPNNIVMAPSLAIPKVLKEAGLQHGDIDLYEIDEVFAAPTVAVIRKLGIDPLSVNVRGGSLGLGYPFGANAARMLVTLLYTMNDLRVRYGIMSMCIGGRDALSIAVERD